MEACSSRGVPVELCAGKAAPARQRPGSQQRPDTQAAALTLPAAMVGGWAMVAMVVVVGRVAWAACGSRSNPPVALWSPC